MSAEMPADGTGRYAARPAEIGWCVWDVLRDGLVFGAERMTEEQARSLACRLSDAYRRIARGSGGAS